MTRYSTGWGPPGPEVGEGRPRGGPADVEKVGTKPLITNTPSIAQPRHGDGLAAMRRRRRLASYRCELLDSGVRDPWTPWRPDEISDVQADGAAAAVHHLLELGLTPLLQLDVLRALGRRGGDDRALAEQLHALAGGVVV